MAVFCCLFDIYQGPQPPSASALPALDDWTVNADMLGDGGASLAAVWRRLRPGGGWGRQVAEEIAEAREMGIKQRPFPCRYCIAEPMPSSSNFATWCSAAARPSLLLPGVPAPHDLPNPPLWCQHARRIVISIRNYLKTSRVEKINTSEDLSATSGATAAAPPNLLMLKTWTLNLITSVIA